MAAPNQATGPIKFSSDELRVLQQCNKDSFYQRSLPMSAVLGTGTFWAVKAGYLSPGAKFGAVPKVAVAVVVGYLLGKISYQQKCAEKLMALPDSKVGQMLRNRRAGIMESPFSLVNPTEEPSSSSPSTLKGDDQGPPQMDMDFDRPNISGLNDSYRPRIDDFPIPPPISQDGASPTSSYDELRRKNREEYEMKRTKPYRGVITPEEVPSALRQHDEDYTRRRADPEPDLWSKPPPRKPTNVYGDVFEK
uniref:OCIA domain-containing protein 1 n=1 Tax=Lygus hesperus TaxID=30085 RepID=A0A0A9YZH1_LYGHE